ncbi:MAG: GntR family transcriptional regulator [Blautia sp.]|nr:GntR family transcriptional regulator [Blautia sp.]
MIILDYQDRRPIYEQVVEKFRILILNGVLEPGAQMPSVRQLAMELSVNPNTIQRAYMELEQEGYIYPVKGKGNYISDTEELICSTREGYYQEVRKLVEKGCQIGAEEEEVIRIVRNCYKEAGK